LVWSIDVFGVLHVVLTNVNKRTLLFVALLLGAFLFSYKASAEEIFDNHNDTSPGCFQPQNGTSATCTNADTYNDGYSFKIYQDIDPAGFLASYPITDVSIWIASFTRTGTSWTNSYLYLLDINGASFATSTAHDIDDQNEQKFHFTSPVASEDIYGFRMETTIPASGTYVAPRWRVIYPANPLLNGSARYFYNVTLDTLPNGNTFAYSFYAGPDTNLTIDTPLNNSTVTTPFSITGTCYYPVDLYVYEGLTIASSTDVFGSTRSCSGNSYTWTIGNLDQGFWNIQASSTDAITGITIFELNQSQIPTATSTTDIIATPTSTDVLGSIDCGDDTIAFMCRFINRYKAVRPYSYAPAIVLTLWNGMNTSTSTPWTQGVTFDDGNATHTVAVIDSSVFDVVPSSFKTGMRDLSTLALLIGFVWLIWSLRHEII